jgi:hypothetical protein
MRTAIPESLFLACMLRFSQIGYIKPTQNELGQDAISDSQLVIEVFNFNGQTTKPGVLFVYVR